MQLRLFFPLWSMSTLIGEVSSAYRQEINKLRSWGLDYLLPHIHAKRYTNFPFQITITFYIYFDIETTSLMLLASYIVNELGCYSFQSADYRVIPEVIIKTSKVIKKEGEGCEIQIESLRDKISIH